MKKSAGILVYKYVDQEIHFLLLHPGGPFWKSKDIGAWTIPKGEIENGDDPFQTALKEFEEETGTSITGNFIQLNPIKQKGAKTIFAWAVEGDFNCETFHSNTFDMEWPPKSGQLKKFPEIDKAEWYDLETSKMKINPAQFALITEVLTILKK